jgi:tetratricopeptide (TPR) repeat protein
MLGINSRETVQDATYDIQTQDLGPERSIVETQVYRNGKILGTLQSPYEKPDSLDQLHEVLKAQHERICTRVREGTYELLFLWLSRALLALEEENPQEALECLESVLAVEETHSEALSLLEKIRSRAACDPSFRSAVETRYRQQIRALEDAGRSLEVRRKQWILQRLGIASEDGFQKQGLNVSDGVRWLVVGRQAALKRGRAVLLRVREALRQAWQPLSGGRAVLRPRFRSARYATVALAGGILACCFSLVTLDRSESGGIEEARKLARDCLDRNETAKARDLLSRRLEWEQPIETETLRLLWATFDRLGDYEKAVPLLSKLQDKRPSSPFVALYLAEAYLRLGRHEDAIEQYRRAGERNAPEIPCTIGTALCLLGRGEPAAAAELLEPLAGQGLEDYRLSYCLGLAYQQQNRPGRASVHFAQALRLKPDSPIIYRSLAACLMDLHQETEARRLLEEAKRLESNSDPVTASLSLAGPEFPFPLI